jgi:hypothetical protein
VLGYLCLAKLLRGTPVAAGASVTSLSAPFVAFCLCRALRAIYSSELLLLKEESSLDVWTLLPLHFNGLEVSAIVLLRQLWEELLVVFGLVCAVNAVLS